MKLRRRGLLLSAAGALAAAAAPARADDGAPVVRRQSVIDLVMYGGPDCPYCRHWEATELPRLRAAPEFPWLRFTQVVKTIRAPIPGEAAHPAYLRGAVAEIQALSRGRAGSPWFVVLLDGKPLEVQFGLIAYEETIRPMLVTLTGKKRALTA